MSTDILQAYKGKSILITGANGFIASSLIQQLKSIDCSIHCAVRSLQNNNDVKDSQVTYYSGDVSEESVWDSLVNKKDYIFHFAAQTSTYTANNNPSMDVHANIYPMMYMLEACRRKKLNPVILFSSTVTVSGVQTEIPATVHREEHPVTIYDIDKLIAEKYLLYAVHNGFVRGSILRLANVYGPGPASSAKDRGVLNSMIKKAYEGKNLVIYGSGEYIRDYIYVKDAAVAFLYAGASIERTNGRYYLIGSGVGHSIIQAAEVIKKSILDEERTEVPITHIDPPEDLSPIEKRNFIADISEFTQDTHWKPQVSLEAGIHHTIESLK